MWQFLSKLNSGLPRDPTVLLLDIYPKELKIDLQTKPSMRMFIIALFTIIIE